MNIGVHWSPRLGDMEEEAPQEHLFSYLCSLIEVFNSLEFNQFENSELTFELACRLPSYTGFQLLSVTDGEISIACPSYNGEECRVCILQPEPDSIPQLVYAIKRHQQSYALPPP